jgi:hypothetical protein
MLVMERGLGLKWDSL